MSTVAVLVIVAIVLVLIWGTDLGQWLAWNASFFLSRERAEQRALQRLEWKLGLLKRLIRAIARTERRLGKRP